MAAQDFINAISGISPIIAQEIDVRRKRRMTVAELERKKKEEESRRRFQLLIRGDLTREQENPILQQLGIQPTPEPQALTPEQQQQKEMLGILGQVNQPTAGMIESGAISPEVMKMLGLEGVGRTPVDIQTEKSGAALETKRLASERLIGEQIETEKTREKLIGAKLETEKTTRKFKQREIVSRINKDIRIRQQASSFEKTKKRLAPIRQQIIDVQKLLNANNKELEFDLDDDVEKRLIAENEQFQKEAIKLRKTFAILSGTRRPQVILGEGKTRPARTNIEKVRSVQRWFDEGLILKNEFLSVLKLHGIDEAKAEKILLRMIQETQDD